MITQFSGEQQQQQVSGETGTDDDDDGDGGGGGGQCWCERVSERVLCSLVASLSSDSLRTLALQEFVQVLHTEGGRGKTRVTE